MDIATLIGILVSFGLVIISILLGGDGAWFVNAPSLMIVFGGTMGATLLAYPLGDVLSVFKVAQNVFRHKSQSISKLIPMMAGFAKKARREGILSFESQLDEIEDPFLVQGIQMAIDGMESSAIENVMITEIIYVEERHRLGSDIFSTMGTFAPAVGMLGTIIGLVQISLILGLGVWVFRVPINGSLLQFYLAALLFILANLSLGLLISTVARSQLQAMQMTIFFFLPSILLSGFMFPFQGMPRWAQAIA